LFSFWDPTFIDTPATNHSTSFGSWWDAYSAEGVLDQNCMKNEANKLQVN
jgi:hypothetical protein